jgi:hypothetical protein
MRKLDNDYYVINYFLIHEMDPEQATVERFFNNWVKLKEKTEEELLRIQQLMDQYSVTVKTKHSVAARFKRWITLRWYNQELEDLLVVYRKNKELLETLSHKVWIIVNKIFQPKKPINSFDALLRVFMPDKVEN